MGRAAAGSPGTHDSRRGGGTAGKPVYFALAGPWTQSAPRRRHASIALRADRSDAGLAHHAGADARSAPSLARAQHQGGPRRSPRRIPRRQLSCSSSTSWPGCSAPPHARLGVEIGRVFAAIGRALFNAAVLWLTYLGLEPVRPPLFSGQPPRLDDARGRPLARPARRRRRAGGRLRGPRDDAALRGAQPPAAARGAPPNRCRSSRTELVLRAALHLRATLLPIWQRASSGHARRRRHCRLLLVLRVRAGRSPHRRVFTPVVIDNMFPAARRGSTWRSAPASSRS